MINPNTLTFLQNLAKNNNRPWFKDNKAQFDQINRDFKEFADELAQDIARFDKRIANSLTDKKTVKVFRIYRDVRFSKDKSPYKTNLGAAIMPKGMKSGHPGYYMHIQAGDESFIGGGLHMPESKFLNKVREQIAEDAQSFKAILKSKEFQKHYSGLSDYDMLKTVPRGYSKDHPEAELLKYKSYTVFESITDKEITSSNLYDKVLEASKALYEFNMYLDSIIFN